MKKIFSAFAFHFFLAQAIFAQSGGFSAQEFASSLMATISERGFDAALERFSALDEKTRESEQIQYLLASILLSAGRAKEAADAAFALVEKSPKNLDYIYLAVLAAKGAGDGEKKKRALSLMTQIDPYDERANVELADEQMLKKNWQRARTLYQKALTKNESYVPALFGLGKTNYYLKKDAEARAALEKALAADPSFDMAHSYLAKLEAEKSDWANAAEQIRKAIEISPNYYNHWLDLGEYCREMGKIDDAIAAFSRAIELDGGYFLGYVLRGGMRDEKGEADLALRDYLAAIKLNPQYTAIYDPAGQIARAKGDWALCEKIYLFLLEKYPSNISFAAQAVSSLRAQGKRGEAKEAARKAMKNFDADSSEYSVARLFYDNAAADAVFAKANGEPRKDKRAALLYSLAIYFESAGDEKRAAASWQSLCEVASSDPHIQRICEKKFGHLPEGL